MSVPELSREQLEAHRTQGELSDWVNGALSSFASTPEGKSAFRLNKGGLVKQLVEEMAPLKRFAEGFYRGNPDVRFRLVIGNQSYDALVLSPKGRTIKYLQITQAFDGYGTYLRKLHLDQHKVVAITGPSPIKDKQTGRTTQPPVIAVDHQEVLTKTFEDVRTAVERKSKMRYEPGTCLIVNVELFHFLDDSDIDALHNFVRRHVVLLAQNFDALYLVSDQTGFAYEYATSAT